MVLEIVSIKMLGYVTKTPSLPFYFMDIDGRSHIVEFWVENVTMSTIMGRDRSFIELLKFTQISIMKKVNQSWLIRCVNRIIRL